MIPPPPTSTLVPYTTLFRSHGRGHLPCPPVQRGAAGVAGVEQHQHAAALRDLRELRLERGDGKGAAPERRSEEHTSELQSRQYIVCRLLLEKNKRKLQCGCP